MFINLHQECKLLCLGKISYSEKYMHITSGNDDGFRKSASNMIDEVQRKNLIIRNIDYLFVPPKKHNRDHDIALLKFKEIRFTNHFRPICLPM